MDIKWIKLDTYLPDSRKIKQIRKLPGGDSIALFWVFLMCLAGQTNDDGFIYFTPEVPFTEEMLADQFDMELNIVKMALATFQRFGMIEIINDVMCISNWERYQNVDGMDKIREQNKERQQRFRNKKKQERLTSGDEEERNVTHNVTVTQSNGTDKDKDKEIDKDNTPLLSPQGDNTVTQITMDGFDAPAEKPKKAKAKPKDYVSDEDAELIKQTWNEFVPKPKLTKVKDNNTRQRRTADIIRDYGLDALIATIKTVPNDRWLMNGCKGDWDFSYDWLIRPERFLQTYERNVPQGVTAEQNPEEPQLTDEQREIEADKEILRGWGINI